MDSDIQKWINKDGESFLKEIGLKKSQVVLDFGCGEGHYAIPAAKIVGDKGKVYAFDRDNGALNVLERTAKQFGLSNIILVNKDTKVPLRDGSIDVILAYDVIHYRKNRKIIYNEIYRLLKPAGLFSLYPKHYKDDFPLMELADLGLEDIIKEVEERGFVLFEVIDKKCLHDTYYNECHILNFNKPY